VRRLTRRRGVDPAARRLLELPPTHGFVLLEIGVPFVQPGEETRGNS
jgi:hypothetical protein